MPTQFIIPRRTLVAISIVVAALALGGVAYVYLPKASITVTPKVNAREIEQQIILSSQAKEPDFQRFILPARIVEKEVQESVTVQREGSSTKPDFAKGSVRLFNQQDEDQDLLPKTHLRHEATGVFFLTDTAVKIPANSEISVNVTAKEQGEVGNVAPGKFIVDKLPTSLQQVVFGESKQQFSGGISTDTPITEEEVAAAKADIQEKARERAQGELTLAAGGANIRPDLITIDTIEESSTAQPGSGATSFTVSTKVRARAFVVDENDLLSLTLLALRTNLSQDEEFLEYDPQSFSIQITGADFERGEARVVANLTGEFASKIGTSILSTHNLAGLSQKEAAEHFKQFPSVQTAEISLSPFWVRSVPARPGSIDIVIKGQSQKQ